ncbi:hypothetical protein C7452_0818 [Methanothermobacter defluvii]|uniref:Uncharacterized protein n=1 Tax=Methanothermobacter defluvii TaxID=49339 RepID=A0A371NE66_9EURY|nr:hypothetical protein C7452_0818 [Methanothermobacter defluvii]
MKLIHPFRFYLKDSGERPEAGKDLLTVFYSLTENPVLSRFSVSACSGVVTCKINGTRMNK